MWHIRLPYQRRQVQQQAQVIVLCKCGRTAKCSTLLFPAGPAIVGPCSSECGRKPFQVFCVAIFRLCPDPGAFNTRLCKPRAEQRGEGLYIPCYLRFSLGLTACPSHNYQTLTALKPMYSSCCRANAHQPVLAVNTHPVEGEVAIELHH